MPLLVEDQEGADLARLDVGDDRRGKDAVDVDMAAQEGHDPFGAPLVGDVFRVDTRFQEDQPPGEIGRFPGAGAAVDQLSRVRLGPLHHLLEGLVGRVGPGHEDHGAVVDPADPDQVIGPLGAALDRGEGGVPAGSADEEGVPVGLGLGRELGGDGPAPAGLRLDHDGLTQVLLGNARDGAKREVV